MKKKKHKINKGVKNKATIPQLTSKEKELVHFIAGIIVNRTMPETTNENVLDKQSTAKNL